MSSSTTATSTVITNVYKQDIDLSDKLWISMYQKATAGLLEDKKFNFTSDKVGFFRNQVKQGCNAYAWKPVCMAIPISATKTKSLVQEHKSISLDKVVKNKDRIWGTSPRIRDVDENETNPAILQKETPLCNDGKFAHQIFNRRSDERLDDTRG